MPQYSVLQYIQLNDINLLKKHINNLIFYRNTLESALSKCQSEQIVRSIIEKKVSAIEQLKQEMNQVIEKFSKPEFKTQTQLLTTEFNSLKQLAEQEIRVYLAYKKLLDDPEERRREVEKLQEWIFDADMSISFIDIAIQTLLETNNEDEEYEEEDE